MGVQAWLAWLTGRDSPTDDPSYECHQCGERFSREHHQCPHCGGYRVERTDWQLDS